MKKKWLTKLGLVIALVLTFINLNTSVASAASFTVKASTSSIAPGGSFTVTVSVSGAGKFNFSASNGTVSTSSSWVDGSYSFSVKAGQSGTTTVSVTAVDVTGNDESAVTGTKSTSVTIKSSSSGGSSGGSGGSSNNSGGTNSGGSSGTTKTPTDEQSTVNTLSALTVNKGTLSPVFAEETTQYIVTLDSAQTDIEIGATAKDSKAKVSGTGTKTLSSGENKFDIVCTAENGSTKVYTIIVNVDETPTVFIEHNGQKLGVVKNIKNVTVPSSSFVATTATLDGEEIPAWQSEQLGKTIIYLVNEAGEKGFYLFEDGKVVSQFRVISIAGVNMFIVDIDEKEQSKDGMKYQELTIGEEKVNGWLFESDSLNNYELLYLMQEDGTMKYYMHEKESHTFQVYSEALLNQLLSVDKIKKEKQNVELFRNILIGTTALFALTSIGLLIAYLRFKKKSISAIKSYYDKKNQD